MVSEITKVSLASAFGISLEFYDFLIYGFLSGTIASLFFPSQNALVSLLYTFAAFATGFVGRPIGAILFGHLGDRIGRKYTLVFTITLMALAFLLTGLLPTYAQVGVLASILITVLRFLQGVSLGGEFGGGIVLTAEVSPPEKRAFYVGVAQSAQGFGPLLATGLIYIFGSIMSQDTFNSIGWRILFIIGAIIGVIGIIIRLKISESYIFKKYKDQNMVARIPLAEAFERYTRKILLGLAFVIGGTTITYATGVFASSYLQNIVKFTSIQASLILSIGYITLGIFIPIFGYLGDKIGRKPLMLATAIGSIAFVFPYFYLLNTRSFAVAVMAQVIAQLIQSFYAGSYAAMLTEMFPTKVRYTAVSFDYHTAVAAFGGTTPFIATFLIYETGYNLSPVFWGIAGMTVSLIAFIIAKETRGASISY